MEEKLTEVYIGKRAYWDAFAELLHDLGQNDEEIRQTRSIAEQLASKAETRTLFEGVLETLSQLNSQGLRLGILSDTESREARVRQRLADLNIESFFDTVVTSIDIGYAKPQPQAYEIALRRLNAVARDTLFVGHDEEELVGAMHCGVTAVAFNYEGAVQANHRIESFRELCEVVI